MFVELLITNIMRRFKKRRNQVIFLYRVLKQLEEEKNEIRKLSYNVFRTFC